jgi:hypothetical protein
MTILALLLALAAPVQNLPLNAVIAPLTAFRVAWDFPAAETPDGFRVFCDGAILANYSPSQVTKSTTSDPAMVTYTATVPGLPAGRHTCHVVAFNAAGDSLPSNVVEPVMALRASAPVELRFVIEIKR